MILIFSDIHADKKAAKFIENISKGFDEVYCCGDICGYQRDFKYCIDMFKARGIRSVLGNHDYMVIHPEYDMSDIVPEVAGPILWTRKHLKKPEREYLESLPAQITTPSGIFIRHTYGLDYYINSYDDCMSLVRMTSAPIIAIGHTHVFKMIQCEGRVVINPGSISHGRGNTKPGYIIISGDHIDHRELERKK